MANRLTRGEALLGNLTLGSVQLDKAPLKASLTVGEEAGNAILVSIQLQDMNGNALANRGSVLAYLSDDANGDSVAATAPDGGVAIGTDGLAIPLVAFDERESRE